MCDLEHPLLIYVNHSMFPDSTVYYLLAGTLLEAAGLEAAGGCQTLKVRTEY